MGKGKKGKKKRAKNKARSKTKAGPSPSNSSSAPSSDRLAEANAACVHGDWGNFLRGSCKGCHVVHDPVLPGWVVGDESEPFFPEDFGLTDESVGSMPEISVHPDTGLLTLTNVSKTMHRSFYITLGHKLLDRNHQQMEHGRWRDENCTYWSCTSLIVVIPPEKLLDVCYIGSRFSNGPDDKEPQSLDIYSTISELPEKLELPGGKGDGMTERSEDILCLPNFPLGGSGPYLCSQGACGCFTHFFPGTQHAVDLECAVGTPIVAVGDGEIVDVHDVNCVGGIHVANLFKWNSIMLRLDEPPLFVEYVHIDGASVRVKKGQRVRCGEIICAAGDVGFCPTPHLHIQVHKSDAKGAPTIPFRLPARRRRERSRDDSYPSQHTSADAYLPRAGQWCDPIYGLVEVEGVADTHEGKEGKRAIAVGAKSGCD